MKKAILTVLAVLLIFSFVACNPNPADSAKPKVYIISVGITYGGSQYYQGDIPKDMVLGGTVEDATEFATAYTSLLKERGIESELIYMLQNDPESEWNPDDPTHFSANFPTVENFKNKIAYIAGKATENDLFVLFFSGHGAGNVTDTSPSRSDERGPCFVSFEEDTYHVEVLQYEDLLTELKAIKGRKALLFDCCHSGNINTPEDEAAYWNNILGEHGLYDSTAVLTAARYTEYSWSDGESFDGETHGWFTGNVLMYSFGWSHSLSETAATIAVNSEHVTDSSGVSCIDESITVHGIPAENYGISKLNLMGIYNALSEELAQHAFYNGTEGPYYQHMTLSGGPVSRWLAY